MGLAIVHQLLLVLPVPPLVVDVVDRRWSWRQVCLILVVVVVVVVVLIVIVGVLVADQCRGDTNTSSCTETHSGAALMGTEWVKPCSRLQHYLSLVIYTALSSCHYR